MGSRGGLPMATACGPQLVNPAVRGCGKSCCGGKGAEMTIPDHAAGLTGNMLRA